MTIFKKTVFLGVMALALSAFSGVPAVGMNTKTSTFPPVKAFVASNVLGCQDRNG